ncbi:reverse transcriptase domain-containing protein [Tanacetum coccineum]|uniref:Reverse transcriptase domain-containing protein n=1 Tax=Tanacetum coccineum TaxID=301880 RepID=A0ABQ5GVT1_9ASTR
MKSIQTFLKKFNHISFRETSKVLSLAWEKFFEIQHAFREKQHQPEDIQELLRKLLKDLQIINEELAEYINSLSWNRPAFYDDDDEYTIQYREYLENSSYAITPDLSTKEPGNSLSMGDEHLSTIPETESDEVINSGVEDLVPIPSESEGIFDNMCDKNHFDAKSDLMESLLNQDTSIFYSPNIDSLLEEFAGELAPINPISPGIHEADFDPEEDIRLDDQLFYDDTSSDDDYFEDIDYVEASPLDFELVSLEEVKDDILREKLLNINLLIAKIKSLNDNPTPDRVLKSPSPFLIPVEDSDSFFEKSDTSLSYNSLPEFETFSDHTEETSSGSTTTHADNSLPEYDLFLFEIEPDQGELTSVVMEDILGEPRVHVPNVLPTHPTLSDSTSFLLTIPSDPILKFLILSELEIRYLIRGYSLKSNPRDFYLGILFLSHLSGKITSDFSECPMMISGGDIPFLDDCPDFEGSRAHADVLGGGSFGSSYKAALDDGPVVVVKQFKEMHNVRKEEFYVHLTGFGRFSHPNLLSIVAFN